MSFNPQYVGKSPFLSTTPGSAGSTLVGDNNSYSNFTPLSNSVKGALTAIDIALLSVGSTWFFGHGSPGLTPVSWDHLTNIHAFGSALTKVSPDTAGFTTPNPTIAYSNTTFSAPCKLSFVADATVDSFCGFADSIPSTYAGIQWGLFCEGSTAGGPPGGRQLFVNELGGIPSGFSTAYYMAGDTLSVVSDGTTVEYQKNGTTFFTSSVPSTGQTLRAAGAVDHVVAGILSSETETTIVGAVDNNLYLDFDSGSVWKLVTGTWALLGTIESGSSWLFGHGSPVGTDVSWDNLVGLGLSISPPSLSKVSDPGLTNNYAYSNTTFTGACNLTFTADASVDSFCGLTDHGTPVFNDYADITWGFYCNGTFPNQLTVIENGTGVTNTTFVTSDNMSIVSDGSTVTYYKNGVLIYTSSITSAGKTLRSAAAINQVISPAIITATTGTTIAGSNGELYLDFDSGSVWKFVSGMWTLLGSISGGGGGGITSLTNDVIASGTGAVPATIAAIQGKTVSGTTGTANVVFSAGPTLTGVLSGGSATFSSTIGASNFSGTSSGTNTGDQTITLTGHVTGSGTGSFATTIASGVIVNSMISATAAIAYSKLNLTGDIVNADIASAAAIAYSKLNLSASVLNTDLNSGAATSTQALFANGTGGATYRNIVSGDLPSLSGTYLPLAGGTMSGAIAMGSNKITGLANGTLSGDAVNFGQLSLYVPLTQVGAPSGVASLDGSGKIPVAQLPSVVMEYQGRWDPSTNTPALSDGTGTNGNVYWVSVAFAGPVSGLTDPSMVNFQIGDLVIYSSLIGKYELTTPAAGVSSVNGSQGAVTVNAINQITGDVTVTAASGSQSKSSTISAIQGTTVSGTTGTGNVVFSASPTLTGTLTAATISASGTVTGSNLSGTNTGDVTLGAFGSTPNANGASLSGQVLTLQPADGSNSGGVSTTTQSFAGDKTLTGNLRINGTSRLDSNMGIGGAANGSNAITLSGSVTSSISQFGIRNNTVIPSTATSQFVNMASTMSTAATSFTVGNVIGFEVLGTAIGAGSSITRQLGFYLNTLTTGVNNAGLTDNVSFTGNWFINQSTATDSTLAGNVTLASSAASATTIGNASSTAVHRINGGIDYKSRTVTATTFTVDTTSTDYIVYTDSTSNAITITLPAPTSGRELIFQDKTGTAVTNNITIKQNASETINGLTQIIITQAYGKVTLTSDGTNWNTNAPNVGSGIRAGSQSVGSGSTSQAVTFSSTLGTTGYAITAIFVNTTDSTPQFQPITITAQSATGFTASWNAPTATANYSIQFHAILNT